MQIKIKIIILVLVILLATSIFIVFSIQNSKLALLREYNYTKEKLTQENEQLANRLNSTLADSKRLKDRLEVIQGDLERISSERNQIQRKFELVNKERQELLEKIGSYAQLQRDLEFSKKENKSFKEEISSLREDNLILKADLSEFRKDKENVKQKIEEAKHILKGKALMAGYAKEQELDVTQEPELWSIDLPPIVVSPPAFSDKGLSFLLEGAILNVNREYNFIVVDLGQRMGVKEGMVFEVYRQKELLGKVEVIQLRQEIAACDIIQADSLFEIGDIVRY